MTSCSTRSVLMASATALFLLAAAPAALAQPGDLFSGTFIINEDDGFSGVCAAPCFAVEKQADVYSDGAPGNPGFCPAGNNTYLYTLTHIGGTIPFPNIPIDRYTVTVPVSIVTAAGFIPGAGIAPVSTVINPLTVQWDFPQSPACPACLDQGKTSEQLFICSPAGPGVAPEIVSTTAIVLDAPGECVVPVQQQCALEIDKTCCLPPPPTPPGDICEGKVIRAKFEIVDGDCSDSTNLQDGKASCDGDNPIVNPVLDTVDVVFRKAKDDLEMDITPTSGLAVGDTLEITSATDPTIKNQLKLLASGLGGTQNIEIHTSCSKALNCNDQFGVLKLVELETTLGGTTICNAPTGPQTSTNCVAGGNDDGVPCDSKLTEATFKFVPSACQNPLPNPQGGDAECSGDASDADDTAFGFGITYTGKDPAKISVIPAAGLQSGDTFQVVATGRDELHSNTPLLITDGNSVEQSIEIHTSCSKPLACGDVFGSLTLVGFKTKEGQVVECDVTPGPIFADSCECPLAPPTPHCTDKLERLHLAYIGDLFGNGAAGCQDNVSNGQDGKASCIGDDLTDAPASITILTDPSKVTAEPASGINEPGVFSIQKEDNGTLKDLPSDIEFTAMDGTGMQTVKIHTSCSKPLNLGDRFGNFVVFGMDRGDGDNSADSDSDSDSDGEDGLITLGCVVEYQYTVTNPGTNPGDAVDVEVLDNPLGTVVTGETLALGETKTFFKTATLYESLTNQGTVSGELATGGECTMADDSVDVTVTLPPPGAFDCSDAKPIDELTMEWAGAGNVCVVAYDGDVGGTQIGAPIDNVAPGDDVVVSGIGGSPNDQQWQIFAAGDCGGTPLGTSEFHISCSDGDMNGVEDCGRNQGNGKDDDPALINDWLLKGMSGDETLDCEPIVVPSGGGGGFCGLGFELVFVLPGLVWLRGRRRRAAA